ncbi:phosphotransferase family protein [Kitasatospora sp. NPDC052868]|uniref:phosphotransferase family protein n=1 Tax=Kitasatospora sp. NPDC052868 TaxID=3364060 RepID=UPI0037C80F45
MTVTISARPQYESTAARPAWRDLPAAVRQLVVRRGGGAVAGVTTAGGGFTPGFAGVVRGPHDTQFVKAVDTAAHPVIADCYRREVGINRALPAGVSAPRVRWAQEAAGWLVLGFDAVDRARMPANPWRPEELAATLDACAAYAEALAAPSPELLALGLQPIAEAETFDHWRRLAGGGTDPLPAWFPRELIAPLAELEADWAAAATGGSVVHLDLRRDNVLLDTDGRAWICDWNWPCLGASWFDLPLLLATAHADGHDADALFAAQSVARGVAPEQLDAVLAGLAGYFLVTGAQPDPPGTTPALRRHQTWSGEVVLRWLSERRGLPGRLTAQNAGWPRRTT